MKKVIKISVFILLVGIYSFPFSSCKKKDNNINEADTVPVIVTSTIKNITHEKATGGGEVTDDKGNYILLEGVCWSTHNSPTIEDDRTIDGLNSGPFTSNLHGLTPNTTYYVRAYARGNVDTWYGNEVSFTTSAAPVLFMNMKIDGNPYNADNPSAAVMDGCIKISGSIGNISIIINTPEYLQPGTYDLGPTSSYFIQHMNYDTFKLCTSNSGTLVISEYNTGTGKISGTFECIAVNDSGTLTVHISNGEFQVYLEQ